MSKAEFIARAVAVWPPRKSANAVQSGAADGKRLLQKVSISNRCEGERDEHFRDYPMGISAGRRGRTSGDRF